MKKFFLFVLIFSVFLTPGCHRDKKPELNTPVSGFSEAFELDLVGLENLLHTFVLTQAVQIDIGQLQGQASTKESTTIIRASDGAYHLKRISNLNPRNYDLYLLKDKALQKKSGRRYKVLEPERHLRDIISDQVFAWRDYWHFLQRNFGIVLQEGAQEDQLPEGIEKEYIRFSTPMTEGGPEVSGYFLYNHKFKTITEVKINCKYVEDDQTIKWLDIDSQLPDYSAGLGYIEVQIYFQMKIDKIGETNILRIPHGYL